MAWICMDCGLPDPYHGAGDGIGSCDCCRCEYCAGPPGLCSCEEDDLPPWPDDVIVSTTEVTPDGRCL